jgi:mannose-6-phosphate isomerase-like protein (cupin superfamily)
MSDMKFNYPLNNLLKAHAESGKLYHEFLRVPDMSAGLYILPAGSQDPQQAHDEDEMYYIVRGKSKFFYDGQDVDVSEGLTLYVPKFVEHRFHSIEEELVIIVFFAPAEGSQKGT